MIFILGIIVGILLSILVVITLTYFRRILETKITVVEKHIESKGPKPKGYIIEPDEAEEIRSEIISKNRKLGRDTTIQELI